MKLNIGDIVIQDYTATMITEIKIFCGEIEYHGDNGCIFKEKDLELDTYTERQVAVYKKTKPSLKAVA